MCELAAADGQVRGQLVNSRALLFALLVTLSGLDIVATVCVLRSMVYSASQKGLQLLLVWVLPLLGATFVLIVWAHDRTTSSRGPTRDAEGPWLPGLGPMSDSSHRDGGFGAAQDGHGGDSASSGH